MGMIGRRLATGFTSETGKKAIRRRWHQMEKI
jgi:hypothetical protein